MTTKWADVEKLFDKTFSNELQLDEKLIRLILRRLLELQGADPSTSNDSSTDYFKSMDAMLRLLWPYGNPFDDVSRFASDLALVTGWLVDAKAAGKLFGWVVPASAALGFGAVFQSCYAYWAASGPNAALSSGNNPTLTFPNLKDVKSTVETFVRQQVHLFVGIIAATSSPGYVASQPLQVE